EAAELLTDRCLYLLGVVVDAHWRMGDQRRYRPTGTVSAPVQGRQRDIAQVRTRAYPANGPIGLGAPEFLRFPPEGGCHDGYVDRLRDAGVGVIIASGKVYGPGVQQGRDDAQIFLQVPQGGAEVDPIGLLHTGTAAGAQSQAKAPRRELS